ncbi:MAG: S1 RNA-binding domain-containing protein [Lachnospiraceae bacterium]|nr:S1 RNA-binding domain-containing protein [Lachnospiraceae bacterium]
METEKVIVAEAAVETPAEAPETMNDYAKELEASFRKIGEGDIISGTVIALSEEEVILDLNYYAQGIIKAADMSKAPDFLIMQEVKTGDTISATVIKTDDGQGNILLSRILANQVLAWDKLEEYRTEGRDFEVKISGITKGGATCFLEDIRGFIPASQLSLDYIEDFNPWLHKTIKARVITVDRAKEKLVLSAKVILQEEAKVDRERKISMIIPGSVLEGKVEKLTDFGAFINLGDGISGLVHISQISVQRIKTAAEVLKVGDQVKTKVLKVNDGKISLSIKALEEEAPVEKIQDFNYKSEGELTTSLGSLFANLKL